MQTLAQPTLTDKPTPQAWYGQFGDQDGIWLIADNQLHFREDTTETWTIVDLHAFRAHGIRLGRVDLADTQQLADGDRVYRCSQTLQRKSA